MATEIRILLTQRPPVKRFHDGLGNYSRLTILASMTTSAESRLHKVHDSVEKGVLNQAVSF